MISISVSFSGIAFLALAFGLLALFLDSGKLPLNPLSTLMQVLFMIGFLYILIPAIFFIQAIRDLAPSESWRILEVAFEDGEFIAARAYNWHFIEPEDYRLLPWVLFVLNMVFAVICKRIWTVKRYPNATASA